MGKVDFFGVLRTYLHAAPRMVVILCLEFVEAAIPHLVRQSAITRVGAIDVGADIANLISAAVEPGVQLQIRRCFGQFMAGCRSGGIRGGITVWRWTPRSLAHAGVAERLVTVH